MKFPVPQIELGTFVSKFAEFKGFLVELLPWFPLNPSLVPNFIEMEVTVVMLMLRRSTNVLGIEKHSWS